MALYDIVNVKGENTGQIELNDQIFGIEPNKDVLFRFVDMQLTNKRAGTAHTKTRAEVRGGGRKPWAQKGTGRARAGSIRSPLFRTGGVTFGPRTRKFNKSLNKKMKKLALKSALSIRVQEKNLIILDDIRFENPRTKQMKDVLTALNIDKKRVLFVLPYQREEYKNVKYSSKNIREVKVLIADNPNQDHTNVDGLNVFDLLKNEKIIMTKETIEKIQEVLG